MKYSQKMPQEAYFQIDAGAEFAQNERPSSFAYSTIRLAGRFQNEEEIPKSHSGISYLANPSKLGHYPCLADRHGRGLKP
jgi:hypothetical protein